MKFKYQYKIKPSDLWQFHMYYAYSSYLCIINIICIISSIALIFALWENSPGWFRGVLLLFLSLFTVIQPLSIYQRAKKQAEMYKDELELEFDDNGIRVRQNGKMEEKNWNQLLRIIVKPTMVVIYTDVEHGYILTSRVLKDTKKDFVKLVKSKRIQRT